MAAEDATRAESEIMTPDKHPTRTVPADKGVRDGRFAKAQQFLQVADDARDLSDGADISDACVTLYVHAGIAAADALCARALGKYSRGQDHQEAVTLLASVDKDASNSLRVLLGMKTRAGYGHDPMSESKLVRAERAARSLVEKASVQ